MKTRLPLLLCLLFPLVSSAQEEFFEDPFPLDALGGGGAEINDLEATDPPNVIDDEVYVGTGAAAGAWIVLTDCNAAGEAVTYDTATNTWGCITGLGTGGTVDDIVGDDNLNATTGANISIDGGTGGIDTDTPAASDVLTITFDSTEVGSAGGIVTWGDETDATHVWTWGLTAGDPVITFGNGFIDVSTGELRGGGSPALLDSDLGGSVQDQDAELDTIAALVETNTAVMFVAGGAWTADTSPAIVGTDFTGTAAAFTSSNVTTNADLTGHVTSTGNAALLGSFTVAQLNTATSDATLCQLNGTNCDATQAELDAQDEFSELGGTVGDAQIAAGAVDGGLAGEIQDGTIDFPDIDYLNENVGADVLLAVDECYFVADAGGLFGGIVCEGSAADASEQVYTFPDVNGADTEQEFIFNDSAFAGDVSGTISTTQIDDVQSATSNTESVDDNTTQVATTAFVQAETVAAGDVTGTIGGGLTIGTDTVAVDEIDQSIAPTWTGDHIFEAVVDIGTVETFGNPDTTPDVSTGMYWTTNTVNNQITDFTGTPASGDMIVILASDGGTILDCTGSQLECGTTDITMTTNDVATFVATSATIWTLISYVDQGDDLGNDATGAVTELNDVGDVVISAPADGEFIVRDQTTDTDWENVSLSGDIASVTVLGAVTLTDGASTRTNLGLAIGTDVQAFDDELITIAGLTETNNAVMFVAAGAWTADVTPAIDCADCTNYSITAIADATGDNTINFDSAEDLTFDKTVGGSNGSGINIIARKTGIGNANGLRVQLDNENVTGTADGLRINLLPSTANASFDSGLLISFQENTGGLTAGIRFTGTSTGVTTAGILIENTSTGAITTGIDVSDVEIGDAISLGVNPLQTAAQQIETTELDILASGVTFAELTSPGHTHADAANGGDVALATGSTAFTQSIGNDSTSVATTAFVQAETAATGNITGSLGGGFTIDAGEVTEAMMSTEDFGDFSCGAGADDCLLDSGVVDSTAIATDTIVAGDVDASLDTRSTQFTVIEPDPAGTNRVIHLPPVTGTMTRIDCEVMGGTNFVINICDGEDYLDDTCAISIFDATASTTLTCVDGGANDTALNATGFVARDKVSLILVSESGTVDQLTVYITSTVD